VVDDHADRAYTPGQVPVAPRADEPLWPPDEIVAEPRDEGNPVSSWTPPPLTDAPATPNGLAGVPQPVSPQPFPSPAVPPVAATPPGPVPAVPPNVAVPPRPGAVATPVVPAVPVTPPPPVPGTYPAPVSPVPPPGPHGAVPPPPTPAVPPAPASSIDPPTHVWPTIRPGQGHAPAGGGGVLHPPGAAEQRGPAESTTPGPADAPDRPADVTPTSARPAEARVSGKASVPSAAGRASVTPGPEPAAPATGSGTHAVAPPDGRGDDAAPGSTTTDSPAPVSDAGPASGEARSSGDPAATDPTTAGPGGDTPPAPTPPQAATATPEAGRAAPVRGRATLPGTPRGAAPETGTAPRPAESPWAQPPQRPATAPTAAAPASAPPAGDPAQPGDTPPPADSAPAGAGTGAETAGPPEPPTTRVGPFPPSMGGVTYPPGRPVSTYPVPPGTPAPTPPGAPAPYPPPPYPPASTYPTAPGHPTAPGYPGHPPVPPGWVPPPPPGVPGPAGASPQQPGVVPVPQQPHPGAPGAHHAPVPPAPSYSDPLWTPDGATPTADEFARRRAARPAEPVAQMGVRAALNKTTLGLVKLPPGRHEQEIRHDIEMIRRNFGGLRQVTVVNPKGGAGKTVAILLLAMTFGQKRGGYVLAWDNNETQGTLGMRAQQDFHSRTVRDLLRDLHQFKGAHGRVGDLSQYVRSQGEGMFDVLASDESATGGEMLTAAAFAEIREVVSRFYKLIFVDTGNNVRAQNWQAAIDATDQLVVTMSARNDSAETAARMLDHLEQSGRQRLVRQAVTVVSMPPSRKEIDLPPIQRHFAARTRTVLLAPYERLIDTGEPIRYAQLSSATKEAWLKIAAAVAEGL